MEKTRRLLALDIGQCCIDLDLEAPLRYFNLTGQEEFLPAVAELAKIYEFGQLTTEEFFLRAQQLVGRSDATIDRLREAFCLRIGREKPGMAELLRRLKDNGVSIVFFSDTSIIHKEAFFQICPLLTSYAVGGVYSYEVGAWKPDDQMYEAFEQRYGKPDFYADDRQMNIDGGLRHGWNSWQYTTVEAFRAKMEELGWLSAK